MGSVGDCYDNAMAEAFFATLECELIDRHVWVKREEARRAIFDYIERLLQPASAALGTGLPLAGRVRRRWRDAPAHSPRDGSSKPCHEPLTGPLPATTCRGPVRAALGGRSRRLRRLARGREPSARSGQRRAGGAVIVTRRPGRVRWVLGLTSDRHTQRHAAPAEPMAPARHLNLADQQPALRPTQSSAAAAWRWGVAVPSQPQHPPHPVPPSESQSLPLPPDAEPDLRPARAPRPRASRRRRPRSPPDAARTALDHVVAGRGPVSGSWQGCSTVSGTMPPGHRATSFRTRPARGSPVPSAADAG